MNVIPYTGVRVKIIPYGDRRLIGVEVDLPNSPPLVVLRGERGFAMCGFLDINVVNKLGLFAVKVRGVRSVEELLEKEVEEASDEAYRQGVKPGVKVKDLIHLL